MLFFCMYNYKRCTKAFASSFLFKNITINAVKAFKRHVTADKKTVHSLILTTPFTNCISLK